MPTSGGGCAAGVTAPRKRRREQHGADAEREAPETDGTKRVAARDHEEERQERLLGEERAKRGHEFHLGIVTS